MKRLGSSGHYERILAFMTDRLGESELTDHEKLLVTRWNEAFTFMRNYNTVTDAAALLMKRFPGLSRPTAYRDCANAISLFGDITQSTKEGIRHLSTEIAREAIQMARTAGDYLAMLKGAEKLATINGVNLTDPDTPDFDKLEPHHYELKLDPLTLAALQQMIKGGEIDLSALISHMGNLAEDAEIIDETKLLPDAGDPQTQD